MLIPVRDLKAAVSSAAIAWLFLGAIPARAADVPNLLPYQGRLTNSMGLPISAPTVLQFTLIRGGDAVSVPGSGIPVYRENQMVDPDDSSGVFSVAIGAGTAASTCDENGDGTASEPCALSPADFPDGGTLLFLEVRVDPNGVNNILLPRQRLTSVAYAMRSGRQTLDDGYDAGGPGAGRTINADAGRVHIVGDGLLVDGKVGIGTTSPARTLEIAGGGSLEFVMRNTSAPADQRVWRSVVPANGTFGIEAINDAITGGTRVMTFARDGSVGIGTYGPTRPLDVAASGGIRISRSELASSANEMFFQDNGQIRSSDDAHRIIFDRTGNALELREFGDLVFSAGATSGQRTQRVTFTANGRVGIGTSGPQSTLDVAGTATVTGDMTVTNGGLELRTPGGTPTIDFSNDGTSDFDARMILVDDDSVRLEGANLGIGSLVPGTNKLQVEGEASKTTAGGWAANSDGRIKTGVETLKGALEMVDQVRLVRFRYTDEYRALHASIEDRPYVNVIAQEFRQALPEAVRGSGEFLPDGHEILQVDTYPLTIYTAAAVQELHVLLQEKEARIRDLERRLERLELLVARPRGGR